MIEPQHEGEEAVLAVDMADPHPPRRQPAREAEAEAAELQEIMVAEEMERAVRHLGAVAGVNELHIQW